jgi:HEAT repeat protein
MDFSSSGIRGVNVLPASDGQGARYELQYMQEQPRVLRGTLDDAPMRDALIFIVRNNQRFDSGLRLESLDALRSVTDDEKIRELFCYVARNDRNPAVRLKALEALRGFQDDDKVRNVLLEALLRDENPGARVEAIDALKYLLEKPEARADAQLVDALRDRMHNDSNTYIRMQSAATIQQIAARTQH